ncbi:MAG: hypothetical protein AB7P20_18160 [Rhizobiaceae bacterium]
MLHDFRAGTGAPQNRQQSRHDGNDGLAYLAAAALEKPSSSWLVFFGSVIVITAAKMGFIGADATWVLFGIAAAFLGYGVVRGGHRSASGLTLQTIAMVAFGAVAAIALYVDRIAGAYLVAVRGHGHARRARLRFSICSIFVLNRKESIQLDGCAALSEICSILRTRLVALRASDQSLNTKSGQYHSEDCY